MKFRGKNKLHCIFSPIVRKDFYREIRALDTAIKSSDWSFIPVGLLRYTHLSTDGVHLSQMGCLNLAKLICERVSLTLLTSAVVNTFCLFYFFFCCIPLST